MYAVAKGIQRIQYQFRFSVYKSRPFDTGIDFAISDGHCSFENTADNTLLTPDLAFAKFPVGVQTGQLGARACATWRAVVCLAGAKDEVLAIGQSPIRGAKQLN